MSAPATTPRDPALAAYVAAARKAPYLTAEQELDLARRARDGDKRAADRLAMSHLRLVVRTALRYRGYEMPMADLIGEGVVGLMQAVQRFEPERGWRFATLAMHWVRSAIQYYILFNRSLVKMGTTAAGKTLFFNLPRHILDTAHDGDLSPEKVAQIAKALDVPAADVVSMHRRMKAPDESLNAPQVAADGDCVEWQDLVADPAEGVDAVLADAEQDAGRRQIARTALESLRPAEREILIARRLRAIQLDPLALQFGISRERVRQIESAAMEKLRAIAEREVSARRRAMMARHSWAMAPVKLAPADPERDAREIAESDADVPRRRRRVAVAA